MRWDVRTPPPEWLGMRETWWHWHLIRTFTGVAGFFLLASGVVFWPASDGGGKEHHP
jgi:drug/metabolite transporter (DMT)-like permease